MAKDERFEISVKTRLGMEDAREFDEILKVYNRFPIKEVIIHPRVRADFYNGKPDLDTFAMALEKCKHPVCYNGDIWNVNNFEEISRRFPMLSRVMLGRGVIANPGLVREIKTGQKVSIQELRDYHDALYRGYLNDLGNEKDVFYKMKELWFYLGRNFEEGEKAVRLIQKASKPETYKDAVREIFKHNLK